MRTADRYLVVDLEATCDEDYRSFPRAESEVIEIGAVLVDGASLRAIDELQTFVRPKLHPRLTPFCVALTSIRQEDVDAAPVFPDAMKKIGTLLSGRLALFCSWGDYDWNQLTREAKRHGLRLGLGSEHENVKEEFRRAAGDAKKLGLGEAITRVGLEFEGTAHRGIDDARNIARLLPYVLGRVAIPKATR